MIEMEAIVKEKIVPERLPRTIPRLERLSRDVTPPRGTFGSMIFLPAMSPPHSLYHQDRMNRGDMTKLHERRALGW